MRKIILIIVLDLCIVIVVLKFFSRDGEKACPLTNHKVKRSALFNKTGATVNQPRNKGLGPQPQCIYNFIRSGQELG